MRPESSDESRPAKIIVVDHFWALAAGFRPWSIANFVSRMQERYERKRMAKGNIYLGVALHGEVGSVSIEKAKVVPKPPV